MQRHDVQEVELNTNLMDSDQLRRHYRFWALPRSPLGLGGELAIISAVNQPKKAVGGGN